METVEMGKLAEDCLGIYERELGKLTINGPSKAAMKNPKPLDEYIRVRAGSRT